jgi:hypothetical protein
MLGWLAKNGEDARVSMCVKEVKWDLEKSDSPRRAMLLLYAQIFRITTTDKNRNRDAIPLSYFDQQLGHSRAELVELYSGIENIRNGNIRQREQLQKSLIGGMPDYAIVNSKAANRGIEIWMCTLGSATTPNTRNDVQAIWSMLSRALPYVPEAMQHIQEIMKLTQTATGSEAPNVFDIITVPEWLANTLYRARSDSSARITQLLGLDGISIWETLGIARLYLPKGIPERACFSNGLGGASFIGNISSGNWRGYIVHSQAI